MPANTAPGAPAAAKPAATTSKAVQKAPGKEMPMSPTAPTSNPELLGSLTTQQQQRTSARVIKKLRLDDAADRDKRDIPECDTQKLKEEEKESLQLITVKQRMPKALWSSVEKDLFFEALNEYGKDFDAITSYICAKIKKKGLSSSNVKTKNQVSHFYYRTWQKLSKHVHFDENVKKVAQELYALINYGELRRKLSSVQEKLCSRLHELVSGGVLVVRARGRNLRVRTPACRALRTLNQLTERGWEARVCGRCSLMLRARDAAAWARAVAAAHNPRIVADLPLRTRLRDFIDALQRRWQTRKPKREKLCDVKDPDAEENCDDEEERLDNHLNLEPDQLIVQESKLPKRLALHVGPPPHLEVQVPLLLASEHLSSQNICFQSYLERVKDKDPCLSGAQPKLRTPKRHRKDSTTDKDVEPKKFKPDDMDSHRPLDIDDTAVDGIELMASYKNLQEENPSTEDENLQINEEDQMEVERDKDSFSELEDDDKYNNDTDNESDQGKKETTKFRNLKVKFRIRSKKRGGSIYTLITDLPKEDSPERTTKVSEDQPKTVEDQTRTPEVETKTPEDENVPENTTTIPEEAKVLENADKVEDQIKTEDQLKTADQKVTNDQQKVTNDQKPTNDQPKSTNDQPKSTNDQPKATSDQKVPNDQPKASIDQKVTIDQIKFSNEQNKVPSDQVKSDEQKLDDDEKLMSDVDEEYVKKQIRKGWSVYDAGDLTIGDLYLMFGSRSKMELDYWWAEPSPPLPRPTTFRRTTSEAEKSSPTDKVDKGIDKSKMDKTPEKGTDSSLEDDKDKRESDTDIFSPKNVYGQDSNDGLSGDERKGDQMSVIDMKSSGTLKLSTKLVNRIDTPDHASRLSHMTDRLKRLLAMAGNPLILPPTASEPSKCNCGHVCPPKKKPSEVNIKPAPAPAPAQPPPVFRHPPPIAPKAEPEQLRKEPNLCDLPQRRRGRSRHDRHVVVQRLLPLLPKLPPNNLIPVKLVPSPPQLPKLMPRPAPAPPSLPQGHKLYLVSECGGRYYLHDGDRQILISQHAPDPGTPEAEEECKQEATETEVPKVESAEGDAPPAENSDIANFLPAESLSMSPSRLLSATAEGAGGAWLEGTDFSLSLSSFLGRLEGKPPDVAVDSQLQSLMAESSVDYVAKFADLAAEVTGDQDKPAED